MKFSRWLKIFFANDSLRTRLNSSSTLICLLPFGLKSQFWADKWCLISSFYYYYVCVSMTQATFFPFLRAISYPSSRYSSSAVNFMKSSTIFMTSVLFEVEKGCVESNFFSEYPTSSGYVYNEFFSPMDFRASFRSVVSGPSNLSLKSYLNPSGDLRSMRRREGLFTVVFFICTPYMDEFMLILSFLFMRAVFTQVDLTGFNDVKFFPSFLFYISDYTLL